MMSHVDSASRKLKLIVAAVVVSAGAVGIQWSASEAGHEQARAPRVVESPACRAQHGDDDRAGERDRRWTGYHSTTGAVQQTVVVSVPRTAFVRVDASGRITAAATNSGCVPRRGDDVYLFRPNGTIEQSPRFDVTRCQWTGDFTVPAKFQPQNCRATAGDVS